MILTLYFVSVHSYSQNVDFLLFILLLCHNKDLQKNIIPFIWGANEGFQTRINLPKVTHKKKKDLGLFAQI